MTEFDGVTTALGQALAKRGYTDLTPVQTAILAPELTEADVLVSAQTGSGKTVAFGLALAPTLLGGEARPLFALPGLERMAQQRPLHIDDIRAVGQDWRIVARPSRSAKDEA